MRIQIADLDNVEKDGELETISVSITIILTQTLELWQCIILLQDEAHAGVLHIDRHIEVALRTLWTFRGLAKRNLTMTRRQKDGSTALYTCNPAT